MLQHKALYIQQNKSSNFHKNLEVVRAELLIFFI